MAHGALIRGARLWAGTPALARIAIVYLLARAVTTALLVLAAQASGPASRYGSGAGIGDFVLGWDAQWYWLVAVQGYPSELPLTEAGTVAENAWAFMPVYAYLAQAVGVVLGSWGAGALLVSLVAGFGACVALHRLLRPRLGASAALWAVALFAFGPLAALFQVGYAEALFVMMLLFALDAVARRRYGWLYALIPIMAFTRPGILALALFLGLHGIVRWVRRRREPLPTAHIVHIIALGALATVTGFAWQVIAGAVTGDPGAYLATELAWRRSWGMGEDGFLPFQGWVEAAQFWFGQWGMPAWWGIIVLVLLVAAFAFALLRSRAVRMLGTDIRLWSASYALYLLAVFFPQSSTFRLLLPLTPLAGALAVPRGRAYRLGLLALCVVGQWIWIWNMYAQANQYWQVP